MGFFALALLCACGHAVPQDAGAPAPGSTPTPEQAAALPLARLRAAIEQLEGGSPAQALSRAQLLRVLALREGDGALLS
ncbi:MAG: hypothetical protein GXP55_21205, partial [Deltaproteobacteria bacterium]|nr:hypothetical protein [Deltaproteobacteria bacterium]